MRNNKTYTNKSTKINIFIVLRHVCVVLSLFVLTFAVIDIFNPSMEFMNAVPMKRVILVECICAIVVSGMGRR